MHNAPTPMAQALSAWIADEAGPFLWRYLNSTGERAQRTNGVVTIITHANPVNGLIKRVHTRWKGQHDGDGLTPKARHSAHFRLALHTEAPRFLEAFEEQMLPFVHALDTPSSLTMSFHGHLQAIGLKRTAHPKSLIHSFFTPHEIQHTLESLNGLHL